MQPTKRWPERSYSTYSSNSQQGTSPSCGCCPRWSALPSPCDRAVSPCILIASTSPWSSTMERNTENLVCQSTTTTARPENVVVAGIDSVATGRRHRDQGSHASRKTSTADHAWSSKLEFPLAYPQMLSLPTLRINLAPGLLEDVEVSGSLRAYRRRRLSPMRAPASRKGIGLPLEDTSP